MRAIAEASKTIHSPGSLFGGRYPRKQVDEPLQPWARETLLFNDAFFDSILEGIRQSRFSVDLETYIFGNDVIGHECASALAEAARRGVRVRLIVDGIGSQGWERIFGQLLSEAGVQYRIFHQLPWEKRNWSPASLLRVGSLISTLSKLNHRNHRKVCIIDERVAWVGSQNMCLDHACAEIGGGNWRDTGASLEGPGVLELQDAFIRQWERKRFLPARRSRLQTTGAVILNDSRKQRRGNYIRLLRRFRAAEKRIWITNSYFVPPRSFLRELHRAAERGLDVRVLVPRRSDVTIIPWVTAAFYHGFLKAGVQVYEYKPRILHAKTLIVDNWCLVGSSNLDHRSLLHNLEADVVLTGDAAKRALEEKFLADLEDSARVTWARVRSRPLWERILGRLALYFRTLL